jgi:hypothetical protein
MRLIVIMVLLLLFSCAQQVWHHKEIRSIANDTAYENCLECHMEATCNDCHARSREGRLSFAR